MSIYDNAGVALIPSGTKATKLYSVLPANGDGDFTHDRNLTTATRVNKDGFIEGVAADVPRLDYPLIDGVVQDCPYLLLEPSRTNTITYSENLSSWTFKGSGITITSNDVIAPDGNKTADKIQKTSQNYTYVRQSFTASTGVFSIFVKKGNHRYVGIRNHESNSISHSVFDFDTESFIVTQANRTLSFEKFPNGWYRLIDYVSVADSNTFVGVCISDSSGNEIGTSIPLNSYIYAWGGQRESGQTYATSYIPNLSSGSTTRSADTCNSAGTSAEFNTSEGVLFAEIAALQNGGSTRVISISNGSTSNNVYLSTSSSANTFSSQIIVNGSTGGFSLSTTTVNQTENNKIAIKYKTNDHAMWINGMEVDTHSSHSTENMATLDRLNFDFGTGSSDYYGKTKQLMTFKTALTDSELETLTSWDSFNAMAKGQLYTIE